MTAVFKWENVCKSLSCFWPKKRACLIHGIYYTKCSIALVFALMMEKKQVTERKRLTRAKRESFKLQFYFLIGSIYLFLIYLPWENHLFPLVTLQIRQWCSEHWLWICYWVQVLPTSLPERPWSSYLISHPSVSTSVEWSSSCITALSWGLNNNICKVLREQCLTQRKWY